MSSIMGIFAAVSMKANYRMLLSKNLEVLYLVDKNEMKGTKKIKKTGASLRNSALGSADRSFRECVNPEEDLTQIKPIDFKFVDKLGWMRRCFHGRKTHRSSYMTTTQQAFIEGEQKFLDEFNVFQLLQTVQKLKSAVATVVNCYLEEHEPELDENGDKKSILDII